METNLSEGYDEKHAVEVMRMLNQDRKVNKEFCDGTIISEGKKHSVHKCVVGVVSPFFERAFVAEMQEKYNNVVKIEKISTVTLGNILDFVYTGVANVTDDNVFDLLDGAEFTQIPKIKLKCSDHLTQNTNSGNCLKLGAYAQRYNLENLRKVARKVIAENFMTVLEQEDFDELGPEEVSNIVGIRKDKASEEAAFTAIVRWVNHNVEERRSFFIKLFSLVDLNWISRKFLNQNVKLEPLVFNTFECTQRLLSSSTISALMEHPELSIIAMGGEKSSKSCFRHEIDPNKTENLPTLKIGRCDAAACKLSKQLYLVGGSDNASGSNARKSVEVLDLQCQDEWKEVANMLEARTIVACAVEGDAFYICGGWNSSRFLSSCEKYDCTKNEWSKISNMIYRRGYHAMAVLNGSLYCAGGRNSNQALSSAERYKETTNEWTEISRMNTDRQKFALVAMNGHIYAIGGTQYFTNFIATVEKYDPNSNQWENISSMVVARGRHGAVVFRGRIYVFGGENENGPVTSIEVYDEVADKWEICYEMQAISKAATIIAV